jgi:hypothetical protein
MQPGDANWIASPGTGIATSSIVSGSPDVRTTAAFIVFAKGASPTKLDAEYPVHNVSSLSETSH